MQNTKCISGGESLRSELLHWLVWRTRRTPKRWKVVTPTWTVQQGFLHHTPSLALQRPSSSHCLQLVTLQVLPNSGMGIVPENAHFRGSETDTPPPPPPHPPKKNVGGKNGGKKTKKGRTGFSSATNTREMYGMRSHVAIARLGCVMANKVTCSYSRSLAIGLNADILTHFCAMFRLRKRKCYENFESKFSGVGGC